MPRLKFRGLSFTRREYELIAHHARSAFLRYVDGKVSDEVAKRKAALALIKKFYSKFNRDTLLALPAQEEFEVRLELKELREIEQAALVAMARLTNNVIPGYMSRVDRAAGPETAARERSYLERCQVLLNVTWPAILNKVQRLKRLKPDEQES